MQTLDLATGFAPKSRSYELPISDLRNNVLRDTKNKKANFQQSVK